MAAGLGVDTGVLLMRVVQHSHRSPFPGNIQGQVGQGSEQVDLLQVVLAHCKVVGVNVPFQPTLVLVL